MRSIHFLLLLQLPFYLSCQQAQVLHEFPSTSAPATQCKEHPVSGAANIIFQSSDGGYTWQDISAGLPAGFNPGSWGIGKDAFFLSASEGVYRNNTASKTHKWEKEMGIGSSVNSFSPGADGIIAFNNNCQFVQKSNITGVWMPVFTDFKKQSVRSVFTAKDGSIFIGCDNGLFKSEDRGKTWKHVMKDGWVIQMVESDGVLLCTNERGILRSTDGGANWEVVMNEGGVGIAVEVIKGGFAIITYNTESETRRIRMSTDGGKTWLPIDGGLPPSSLIASIKQVGDTFYCGHPSGIYRSDDGGTTWTLLFPSSEGKVFNLSVVGDVIYAVLREGGC